MKKTVSVIVPAYNEAEHIGDCLNSLAAQSYPKECYEVIVVDNESIDNTAEIAKGYHVTLLEKQPGNVGRMRNLGAKKAKGQILAFIDADCVVDTNWISRLVDLTSNNMNIVFGGGCLLPLKPSIIEQCWLLGASHNRLPKDLIGASIVASKDVFERISGFDENITSGEDTKLHKSAEQLGVPVLITEKISVTHLGNAKTIKEFTKRQVWHGENYIRNFKASLKDPTFHLMILNIFLISTILLTAALSLTKFTPYLLSMILAIPCVFSVKRLVRSKAMPTARMLPIIYILDFLYVQARSYSILRSLFRAFS